MNIDAWIDEFLKKDKDSRQIDIYYASEAGDCPRRIYFSVTKPKPPERSALRVFKLGHMIHDFIYKVINEQSNKFDYIDFERRVTVTHSDFVINGMIDIYVINKKSPEVIEVKSIRSFDYLDKPLPKHVIQLQLYMYATRSKVGHLIYVEKNSLKTRYFPVVYDKKLVSQTIDKLAKISQCIKSETMPERVSEDFNYYECVYCPYKKECMAYESNKTKNKKVSNSGQSKIS